MSIRTPTTPAGFALSLVLATGLMPRVSSGAELASAERYTFPDCIVEATPPVKVGRAAGHFWFPSLHPVLGNDIFCEVLIAYDRLGNDWKGAPGAWGADDAIFCVRLKAARKSP
jgi:hypothetical protein